MNALLDDPGAMIVLTGALVGASGALLGTFLVLRGSAMLTDAIAHSIVLGIVTVWLLTGATSGPLQIAGAALTGVLTVALTEALARSRLVAMDAAVGLVFPALFAAGVLLINLHARDVHIDADTVLLGEIGFVWLHTAEVAGLRVPVAVLSLSTLLVVNLGFVLLLWKELKLATFDAALASALGFAPGLLFYGLLTLTSATAVAAFDAVGAILFIAFVVVPPATALLLTDRLGLVIALAVALAALASGLGYAVALWWDVSIGGMMACITGVFFLLALLAGPRHGVLARLVRRRGEALDHDCRTLVAHLYSHHDGPAAGREDTPDALRDNLHWPEPRVQRVVLRSLDRGLIRREEGLIALTDKGMAVAREIFEPFARRRS